MIDEITQTYRSLIVNRIDTNKYFLLHYHLSASTNYKLSDAALRTLLILTRRTLRNTKFDDNPTISKYGAVVTSTSLNNRVHGEVTLAIPINYVDTNDPIGSIYLLATSAAEYGYCKDVWLMDIEVPPCVLENIAGPVYGVQGIREKLKVFDRPIIGVSLQKLYLGTTESDFRKFVRACIEGGADLIVDDIISVNSSNTMPAQQRAKVINHEIESSRTGRNVGHFVYLNSFGETSKDILKACNSLNIFGVIINSFLMSFGYLHNEIKTNFKLNYAPVIACTNMGSSMLGRNPMDENLAEENKPNMTNRTGVSEVVTAKLSRLIGADAIHTGTAGAECWHPAEFNMTPHTLVDDIPDIKPSMSIAEGDLPISEMGANIRYLGRDVIFEISSGIGLHPSGPKSGCEAYRIISEYVHQNMSFVEFEAVLLFLSKKNDCIRKALELENWKPQKIKADAAFAKKVLSSSQWKKDFNL